MTCELPWVLWASSASVVSSSSQGQDHRGYSLWIETLRVESHFSASPRRADKTPQESLSMRVLRCSLRTTEKPLCRHHIQPSAETNRLQQTLVFWKEAGTIQIIEGVHRQSLSQLRMERTRPGAEAQRAAPNDKPGRDKGSPSL